MPQLFTTYDEFSLENLPFICYIKIIENKYNNDTLNLESMNLMEKVEVKYSDIKYNIRLKGNYNVEDPLLALKDEMEELLDGVTKTKEVVLESAVTVDVIYPRG